MYHISLLDPPRGKGAGKISCRRHVERGTTFSLRRLVNIYLEYRSMGKGVEVYWVAGIGEDCRRAPSLFLHLQASEEVESEDFCALHV